MGATTLHTGRLADLTRAAASLPPHQWRHIMEEYDQSYWYAAGRLDERTSDHGGHGLPHRFAMERAGTRLEYVMEGTGVFRSRLDDWHDFDARESVRKEGSGI